MMYFLGADLKNFVLVAPYLLLLFYYLLIFARILKCMNVIALDTKDQKVAFIFMKEQ